MGSLSDADVQVSLPASADPANVSPVDAPGIAPSTLRAHASSRAASPTSLAAATKLANGEAFDRALSGSPAANCTAKLMQGSWEARELAVRFDLYATVAATWTVLWGL